MPGIDRSRVVGKDAEELEEFVCGICHDVFVEPMTTPCCRRSYCKECIDEWLTPHKSCPMGCNDGKPLTRRRLTEPLRSFKNIIDIMRIRCKLSGDGCPAVHTVKEEAKHMIVCEFDKCEECVLAKGSNVGHNCVAYLKRVNNDLRSIERVVKVEDKDSKTVLGPHKRANEANQSEVVVKVKKLDHKIIELENEVKHYKSMIIPSAIMEAKAKSVTVEENRKIPKEWENIMIDFCSKAIDQFDNTLHSDVHLVEMIKTQLNQVRTTHNKCYSWSVAIFVNQVIGTLLPN